MEALLAAVVAVIFAAYLNSKAGKEHGFAVLKWGRKVIRRKSYARAKGNYLEKIEDAFSDASNDFPIDYAVYQMGIRPNIPIVDALYNAFLAKLLRESKLKKILYFPTTDLSATLEKESGFSEYRENTLSFYGNRKNQVEFVDLSKFNLPASDLLSESFNRAASHIENQILVEKWIRQLDLDSDMSTRKAFLNLFKSLPFDKEVRESILMGSSAINWTTSIKNSGSLQSVVHHINRTWTICRFLHEKRQEENWGDSAKFCSLLWEIEIAKYGIFDYFLNDNDTAHTYFPIFGYTISDSSGTGALPTHESSSNGTPSEQPITVYGSFIETLSLLQEKPLNEVRSYQGLIDLILDVYGARIKEADYLSKGKAVVNQIDKTNGKLPSGPIRKETYVILGQINQLQYVLGLES